MTTGVKPSNRAASQSVVLDEWRDRPQVLYGWAANASVEKGTVDVRVGIKRPVPTRSNEDVQYDDLGTILDVPILVPASASAERKIRIPDGTRVIVIIGTFSSDEWRAGSAEDGPFEPRDARISSPEDAFAIPVTLAALTTDAGMTHAGTALCGNPASAESVAFRQSVQEQLDQLATDVSNRLSALGSNLNTQLAAIETALGGGTPYTKTDVPDGGVSAGTVVGTDDWKLT